MLFLWVTFPCLLDGLKVIDSWGFKYTTCAFTWVKANKSADLQKLNVDKDIRMNMGYYTRANAELCLLAKKGKTLPRFSHSERQVIISHQREHSRKPDEVYPRIENLFGKETSKIELFARTEKEGWDCFGNEINKF